MYFLVFVFLFSFLFFFFNDPATTEIYTLSLHDALPISSRRRGRRPGPGGGPCRMRGDRKSTRLNSSHEWSSYAVFCLKKKKKHYKAEGPYKKKKITLHSYSATPSD